MKRENQKTFTAAAQRLRYSGPAIVDVGSVVAMTAGHSSPVGDDPHNGTTGYYNSAQIVGDLTVDLDD